MGVLDNYNEIVEEVQSIEAFDELLPENDNSEKLLASVTSKSKVDPWRSIAWIVASVQNTFRVNFEKFKKDTSALVASQRVGKIEWQLDLLDNFQFGDSLEVINGVPAYVVIDPTKRIVTNRSHDIDGGTNVLKVVKGVFPNFEKLNNEEYSALNSAIKRQFPPGLNFALVSSDAEEIKIIANVHYDGLKELSVIKIAVESAIELYINTLPVNGEERIFNGSFTYNNLEKAVRAVEGVNDFEIIETEIISNGIVRDFVRTRKPTSGWMRIKTGEPLSSTLTYYANNV